MRKFFWLLLVAGTAGYVFTSAAKSSKHQRRRMLKKQELQVWENEGGSPVTIPASMPIPTPFAG